MRYLILLRKTTRFILPQNHTAHNFTHIIIIIIIMFFTKKEGLCKPLKATLALSQWLFKMLARQDSYVSPWDMGGWSFQKLSVTWGGEVQNFLQERGDKLVKRGVHTEMGGGRVATLLLYSSIIFTVCEGKVWFPLLLFGSSVFWISYARFWSKFLLY